MPLPRKAKVRCAMALVVICLGSTGLARQANDQAEIARIRKTEDERIQAGVRKDTDLIAAATADEYVQQ